MSWRHPAWKVLGIEPTSDARAIRSAYTAKLKAIDPETDPQAFIMLREAFDAAQMEAQRVDAPAPVEAVAEGPVWTGLREPIESEIVFADDAPAPSGPDPDQHTRALATLFYGREPDQPWPTAGQQAAMLDHWHAILADPRMEEIAYYDDAERWFSELIAHAVPFSDMLVMPAVTHFGWLGSDGTIHQTPAITELVYRYRVLEFLNDIRAPGSQHFEAWEELTTPAPGPDARRGRISVKKVHRLLHLVRVAYPDIEGCFDPDRLDLWDRRRTAPDPEPPPPPPVYRFGNPETWRTGLIWAAIVGLVVFFSSLPESPDTYRSKNDIALATLPPPAGEPLDQAVGDIDRVLEGRFSTALDIATIEAKNPALNAALIAEWRSLRDGGQTRAALVTRVNWIIDTWYLNSVRSGSTPLLVEYHRLVLEMGRAVRSHQPDACTGFLDGNRRWEAALGMPLQLRARENALIARVVLETDGSRRNYGRTMVPGEVIDTAASRAHVKRSVVEAWLERRPIGDNYCGVTLAMIEAVLAQPSRSATPLMRVL